MSRKLKILAININNFGNDMIKPVWPGNDASSEENYNEQRKIWNLEENVTKRRKNAYNVAMWIVRKNLDVVLLSEFDLEIYCNGMIRIADEFVDALKNNYNIVYPENFDKEKYDMNKKTGSICVLLVSKCMEKYGQISSPRMKLSDGKSGPWARWINISLSIDNKEYYILGVHIPYGANERTNVFWKKINEFCDEKRDKYTIIIGAFL